MRVFIMHCATAMAELCSAAVRGVALASVMLVVLGQGACDDRQEPRATTGQDASQPATPLPAPDFHFPVLADPSTSIALSSLRGNVVYVDVWASWCHPCLQAMPALNRLRNAHAAKGFEIVGVDVDADAHDGLAALERAPVDYPMVSDVNSTILADYGIEGLPTAFLIDRQGRIRYTVRGFRPDELDDIDRRITLLLAE